MADQTPTYEVGGPGLAWRETGGEIVILDIEESVYFGLNPSAAPLWRRLVVGATHEQLTETLVSSAGVQPKRAGMDVDEFLAGLSRHGLLRERQ